MSFRSGFVTLLGRPNTGKSTLLNLLLGAKVSIVSPRPQTTRTRLQGVLTRENAQIVFVDTPGTHKPISRMNQQMMRSVQEALDGVDLVLVVVDASRALNEEDELSVELARQSHRPSFLVLNKIDIIDKPALLPLIEHFRQEHNFQEYIPVSALTGENRPLLELSIIERLPEGPPYFPADTLTDQPTRFLAAEIVREKIFHQTRQEVPYSTAVVVEKFEEPENWEEAQETVAPAGERRKHKPLVRIQATILVEREGQKGIIIGAKGQRLKRIGEAARRELEFLLNARVYLELFVKTREDWRDQKGVEQLIDWRHL
jgi:GTP-binding protein Era